MRNVTVGLGVNIELNAWPLPPVFAYWLKRRTKTQ
jgi:hypothetical protein